MGCRSGTLQHVDTSTLQASSATAQIHATQTHGVSAVAVLGEDCLVTADCAGVLHAMILSSHPSMASVQQTAIAKPRESLTNGDRKPHGGVFDVSNPAIAGAAVLDMDPRQVLSLNEVLKGMLRQVGMHSTRVDLVT